MEEAKPTQWDIASEAFLRCSKMDVQFEQQVNERLIELAEIETGHTVVDVATGIGDPALSAARRVGQTGRVIATDQSSAMLAVLRAPRDAGWTNIEFADRCNVSIFLGDTRCHCLPVGIDVSIRSD